MSRGPDQLDKPSLIEGSLNQKQGFRRLVDKFNGASTPVRLVSASNKSQFQIIVTSSLLISNIVHSSGSTMMPFPQVNLDITLTELYHMDDHEIDSPHAPVLANAFPSSDLAMTSRYPRNKEYLYQDSEPSKPWSARDQTPLPRIMAC